MFVARTLSCFLLLSLLLPISGAQNVNPGATWSQPNPGSFELGPEETQEIRWTVTYTATTPGNLQVSPAAPAGWTATVTSGNGAIGGPGAQSTRDVVVAVRPTTGTTDRSSGQVALRGTISNNAGSAETQAPPATLTYDAPLAPAAPAPPADNSWIGWLVGALSIVFLIAAGAGFFWMRSRSVNLGVAQQSKEIDRGTGDAYPVRVENRSRAVRTVQLRVAELPPRWVAAFSFPEVKLQPNESTTVPVFVRVPGDTPTGSVGRVRVQARSGPYTAWMASADLLTTVTDVRGDRPHAFPEAAPRSPQGALDQVARST